MTSHHSEFAATQSAHKQNSLILHEEQITVSTTTERHVMVLAGPGTGKTSVIIARIQFLVQSYNPHEIMVLTFSTRAMSELKHRLYTAERKLMEKVWIGTFHAIGVRILKKHASTIGLSHEFRVISEKESIHYIEELLRRTKNNVGMAYKIYEDIQRIKDKLYSTEELESQDTNAEFLFIYQEYQNVLKLKNLVDFGDILLYVKQLFIENKEILQLLQKQFSHVIVDEYQDINFAQYYFIMTLLQKGTNSLFCVGDDDQTIYTWRGANTERITTFKDNFPLSQTLYLSNNYRSNNDIIYHAFKLISHNSDRCWKEMQKSSIDESDVKFSTGTTIKCYESDIIEVSHITTQITELLPYGGSIAILVRNNEHIIPFEYSMRYNDIQYVIGNTRSFIEREEVQLALNILKLSIDPHADHNLKELLLLTHTLNITQINALLKIAAQSSCSLYELACNKLHSRTSSKLQAVKEIIDNISKNASLIEDGKISDAISDSINNIGYVKTITKGKFEKLEDLYSDSFTVLSEHENEKARNLISIIEIAAQYKKATPLIERFSRNNHTDAQKSHEKHTVYLSTIHSSKGMEFDIVFIPFVEEGNLPYCKNYQSENIEDERRLLYVGMTRARHKLCMSHSKCKLRSGKQIHNTPSRFIAEAELTTE
ncbi:DNA helicase II [Candidatus Fokinia solitaria]|uniref:DNA 3'-5' helicase n=1 Tax=Candidatus Fokinia solitaria TaxID=1802984 RepID=A0A2U8BSW3_9RICK|nr:ATP-dependent helicase [Candidatus Fokinia solitaria]AWD33388.1 DNA helicase II [Candidatus Fokinia solitaria]